MLQLHPGFCPGPTMLKAVRIQTTECTRSFSHAKYQFGTLTGPGTKSQTQG